MDCYAAFREVEYPTHQFGDNWLEQREAAIDRDRECVMCGLPRDDHIDTYGKDLHVHHIVPRAEFVVDGEYDAEAANAMDNLMAVCVRCHPTLDEPLKDHRPKP